MPIYEYHCSQCNQDFEKRLGINDVDLIIACPYCQSTDTHKKLSVFSSLGLGGQTKSPAPSGSSCGGSGRFT